MEPYDWQQPIVDKITKSLDENRYAINASRTGAGKTVMALASARDLALRGLIKCIFVICPKVAKSQWLWTAEQMGIKGVLVTNPERISRGLLIEGYGYSKVTDRWILPDDTLVIWDEPHRSASGVKSKATEAMAKIKLVNGSKLLAMSATLADSPLKMRGIGYWAGFHNFSKASFYNWCGRHGCFLASIGGHSAWTFTKNKKHATYHMEAVRKDFGDAYYALDTKDIPNFPEETLEVVRMDMDKSDKKELEETYAAMSDRMKKKGKSDLAELSRMRERIEFCKSPAISDLVVSHISEGKSVVVFCNFTSARERLADMIHEKLPDEPIGMVYGAQSEEERQADIDAFQANKTHIMLVMTAAGGAALSLHDTKHERQRVSLITPSFNAAEVRQALGRIRRCNGTSVEQYFVLAAGTVEDKVANRLESKLACIDSLNDNDLLESVNE